MSHEFGTDFPEINCSKKKIEAELVSSLMDKISTKTLARLMLANKVCWGPWRRYKFDCWDASTYVVGLRSELEPQDGEVTPGYSQIISARNRIATPTPLCMALVNTGGEGYHVGLVINPEEQRIWSKWGKAQSDIGSPVYFGQNGYEVEYYHW